MEAAFVCTEELWSQGFKVEYREPGVRGNYATAATYFAAVEVLENPDLAGRSSRGTIGCSGR